MAQDLKSMVRNASKAIVGFFQKGFLILVGLDRSKHRLGEEYTFEVGVVFLGENSSRRGGGSRRDCF
jgi:hypothetical protein